MQHFFFPGRGRTLSPEGWVFVTGRRGGGKKGGGVTSAVTCKTEDAHTREASAAREHTRERTPLPPLSPPTYRSGGSRWRERRERVVGIFAQGHSVGRSIVATSVAGACRAPRVPRVVEGCTRRKRDREREDTRKKRGMIGE